MYCALRNNTLPNICKFAEGWICTQRRIITSFHLNILFSRALWYLGFFYLSFVSIFQQFLELYESRRTVWKEYLIFTRHRWIKSATLPLGRKFQRQPKIGSFSLILLPWFQLMLNFPRKKVGRITKSNNNNTFTPRKYFYPLYGRKMT